MTEQHHEQRPFSTLIRVRYAECDAQNVVFNARYADYADIAATEFYRVLFGGYKQLLESGLDNQVVRMVTDWQAPAHFDDVLSVSVETSRIGNTSFTLKMIFENKTTGQQVANTELVYVMVDAKTFHKVTVPNDIRHKLEQGAAGVCVDMSGLG